MYLKVKRLTDSAKLPIKINQTDAGFDVFSDEDITIVARETVLVSTGIALEIPEGYYGRLKGRSGLSVKTGLRVIEGTIDSDYRGEIKIMCECFTKRIDGNFVTKHIIKKGERIAQLIIQPLPEITIVECDELSETKRGVGGFGSTGV